MQDTEPTVVPTGLMAVHEAAVRHRVRDRRGPVLYAAAGLSVLLHVWLGLMLYGLDVGPGQFRLFPPDSQPVLLVKWVHDRDAARATPVADPARAPERQQPRPVQRSARASPTADDLDREFRSREQREIPPEPLQARTAAVIPVVLGEQPLALEAPRLEVPARKVPIDPQLRALLVQRVLDDMTQALKNRREAEISWEQDGQPYQAMLRRKSGNDNMEVESVLVDITTRGRNGTSRQTRLTLKRLAFSHFSQLIDRWNPNVQMHADEIVGRFHSNSSFIALSDAEAAPRISGMTTSAGRDVRFTAPGSRRQRLEDVFPAGVELGTRRLDLPRNAGTIVAQALDTDSQVYRFTEDTRLIFHDGGRYTWQTRRAREPQEAVYAPERPVYFLADPGATLFVQGIVDGRVLVYAPERLVIEGHLRYASDPRLTPRADDFLGLVSDKYVEIARPAVTGPGDLLIDAAIFARREFLISDIDSGHGGKLAIYGSLTSGTMSASEPRYATKIEFDPRLDHVQLPGFPATNRYELAHWEPEWNELEHDSVGTTPQMDADAMLTAPM